jgi:hypothetical protein
METPLGRPIQRLAAETSKTTNVNAIDYSKGIILSTGYVGQRTASGLVTCLTDRHPGVSGGGVLDQRGVLVGISIGRMEGDYRFSFILPMRSEMLRKVRASDSAEPGTAAAEQQ